VIAAKLRGRTDNDVKNYWNTKLKKRYMMTTAPSTPATGGDIPPGVDQPPPPALGNLDTALATVEDGGDLTHESERLYAELMGLIEQKSTADSCPSTGEPASPSSSPLPPPPPPPPLGTSPTATSSAGSSSTTWPVDVHDTIQLAESSGRSLVELDATSGAQAFAAAAAWLDSFQDLLASSYDEVIATQLARGAVLL
jgi:myb proto-oncogene protein